MFKDTNNIVKIEEENDEKKEKEKLNNHKTKTYLFHRVEVILQVYNESTISTKLETNIKVVKSSKLEHILTVPTGRNK